MKKIFVFLVAMIMLFAFAACEKDQYTENGVAGGPEDPAESPADTHQHSYHSEVTTASTCTDNGVMTFRCACGDSYTETILSAGHTWSDWEVESDALVGRNGTEKRTCSVCLETEGKESVANAISNSFYDGGLIRILNHNYGTMDATSLLEYACREFPEYADKTTQASVIYDALAKRFDISDIFGTSLPNFHAERYGYDATNDTYTLHDYGDTATIALLGYVHQEGNRYDVYYAFTPDGIDVTLTYKIVLAYNKLDGNPNKYLSIERVSTPPSDMIQ